MNLDLVLEMTYTDLETIEGVLLDAVRALGRTMEYHEARLQAELLLAHTLGVSRALVLARLSEPILPEVAARYAANVARRSQHEPLAYVLGHQEFFGLDLVLDRRVLIPRHESEMLVSLALEHLQRSSHLEPTVVDVGTGSGALILAIAQHVARARLIATDISPEALAVAKLNASRLGLEARIEFRQGDLLEPVPEDLDLLLANLPYIPSAGLAQLPREITSFEPRVSLDGGVDGFAAIRRLLAQLRTHSVSGAVALLEISEEQGRAAKELCGSALEDARVAIRKDLEGLDRVVEISFG